ncbi:MAG: DUF3667 domain-containing protein [Thermoanaerobaculia bacterium]
MSESVTDASIPAGPGEPTCANCGEGLRGQFCHACGQKAGHHQLDFHHFAHEAIHEIVHLDGKIVQTLKLLVSRPGELTRQFVAGRRVRYIGPIRLYLTFSILFFALAAVFPSATGGAFKVGLTPATPGERQSDFRQRLETATRKAGQQGGVGVVVMHNLPKSMFVLMPLFGVLTWAFYRRDQRYYIAHLYYAIHFHAFVFLVLSIALLFSLAGPAGRIAGALLFWSIVPYHFIALRRVSGGSRWATFWKGFVIGAIYWFLLLAAVLIVTLLVLLTV